MEEIVESAGVRVPTLTVQEAMNCLIQINGVEEVWAVSKEGRSIHGVEEGDGLFSTLLAVITGCADTLAMDFQENTRFIHIAYRDMHFVITPLNEESDILLVCRINGYVNIQETLNVIENLIYPISH